MSIEEQNRMIILSRFPLERPQIPNAAIGKGVNEELATSVREHRKENGISSKYQLLRNFIRTRPYVKTTFYKPAA